LTASLSIATLHPDLVGAAALLTRTVDLYSSSAAGQAGLAAELCMCAQQEAPC